MVIAHIAVLKNTNWPDGRLCLEASVGRPLVVVSSCLESQVPHLHACILSFFGSADYPLHVYEPKKRGLPVGSAIFLNFLGVL